MQYGRRPDLLDDPSGGSVSDIDSVELCCRMQIGLATAAEVVDDDHPASGANEAVHQMRAQESCTAGYQDCTKIVEAGRQFNPLCCADTFNGSRP